MDICEQHQKLFADIEVIKNKIDNNTKKFDNVIEAVAKINDRCLIHLGNYNEFREHIAESKKQGSIWSDRRFQIVMFIAGCAWAVMFIWIKNTTVNINNLNGKISTVDRYIRANQQ